ncbi:MAG: hypothetical protein H5U02_00590 [Clostridia bacterium]|nr:hypothetical protein [Clostridia bacterium]
MRTKVVTLNGKQVTVREHKVKELREEVIPKIERVFGEQGLDLSKMADASLGSLIETFEDKLAEFFPDVSKEDIENSYISEVEALVEAWIEVNFTGLKRVMPPLLSLMRMGSQG